MWFYKQGGYPRTVTPAVDESIDPTSSDNDTETQPLLSSTGGSSVGDYFPPPPSKEECVRARHLHRRSGVHAPTSHAASSPPRSVLPAHSSAQSAAGGAVKGPGGEARGGVCCKRCRKFVMKKRFFFFSGLFVVLLLISIAAACISWTPPVKLEAVQMPSVTRSLLSEVTQDCAADTHGLPYSRALDWGGFETRAEEAERVRSWATAREEIKRKYQKAQMEFETLLQVPV